MTFVVEGLMTYLLDLLLYSKWPFATEIVQVEGDGNRVVQMVGE